jgi:hypothetical protein
MPVGVLGWLSNFACGQAAQQVIMQVCISTHSGVICERLPTADENLLFIRGTFTRQGASVKGIRALFGLLPSGWLRVEG